MNRKVCITLRTASSIPNTIQYPADDKLRDWLTFKRREYTARLQDTSQRWKKLSHHDAYRRFARYRRTCHKEEILLAVLRLEEPYQFIDLGVFLASTINKYSLDFDTKEFNQAKLIILFYLGVLKEAIERGEIKNNPTFPPDHPYSEKSLAKKRKK